MPALSPVYTILMHFLLKILNNLLYTLISLIAVHYLIKEETIPSVAVRISRRLKSDKKLLCLMALHGDHLSRFYF